MMSFSCSRLLLRLSFEMLFANVKSAIIHKIAKILKPF